MANTKRPEQRSATGASSVSQGSAPQPTGEEVFSSAGARAAAEPEATPPEGAAEMPTGGLQQLAAEYYERLTEAAEQLAEQARQLQAVHQAKAYVKDHPGTSLFGVFVSGVLIGLLTGRD